MARTHEAVEPVPGGSVCVSLFRQEINREGIAHAKFEMKPVSEKWRHPVHGECKMPQARGVGVGGYAALCVVRRNLERRWDVVSEQKLLLGRWRHLAERATASERRCTFRSQHSAKLARESTQDPY